MLKRRGDVFSTYLPGINNKVVEMRLLKTQSCLPTSDSLDILRCLDLLSKTHVTSTLTACLMNRIMLRMA